MLQLAALGFEIMEMIMIMITMISTYEHEYFNAIELTIDTG